jgi:hypothetical protein
VLSKASMDSGWVPYEIRRAVERERAEKRQVLFPITLVSRRAIEEWFACDTVSGGYWAQIIREYHISDFSKWWKDHDSFEAAFTRLLNDLKAEESTGPKTE